MRCCLWWTDVHDSHLGTQKFGGLWKLCGTQLAGLKWVAEEMTVGRAPLLGKNNQPLYTY